MDPLSIAASSAGLAVTCLKISGFIYMLVDDLRTVDENVNAFGDEVVALSRVLDSISKSLRENRLIPAAQTDPDDDLWKSLNLTLDDCRATLNRLEQLLKDVNRPAVLGINILRRPTKNAMLGLKRKDIEVFRNRIQYYNGAMQLPLQMIALSVLLRSNVSQDTMNEQLTGLRNQIRRVEKALHRPRDIQASPSQEDRDEGDRILQNLQQCVQVAENFHSSASSYAGTIYGGSVFGEPLSNDRHNLIYSWISPPSVTEEPTSHGSTDERVIQSTTSTTTLSRHGEDSDTDLDQIMLQKMQELGLNSFSERKFAKAQSFLQKMMEMDDKSLSSEHLQTIRTKLAVSLCYLEKWDEAAQILRSQGWTEKQAEPFHAFHALALASYNQNQFESAASYCKQAANGKRRILGGSHDSYYESLSLQAQIAEAKGDPIQAEVYRSLVPSYRKINLSAAHYLDRALYFSQVKVLVCIDFGITFSAVGLTLIPSDEFILLDWRKESPYKVPTVLYYKDSGEIVGWGDEITEALKPTGYPKDDVSKAEWFKAHFKYPYLNVEMNLPKLPPNKSRIDVVADYLSKIKANLFARGFPELGGEHVHEIIQTSSSIHYVFTVPTCWQDDTKATFRAAIAKAGFVDSADDYRLSLVNESEAAALYSFKDLPTPPPKKGEIAVVLNCGGATVSLVSLEISDDSPISVVPCDEEIGDTCGATALNRSFSNLLREKIRKCSLPTGSRAAGRIYAKCILDFERRIKADFRNDGQKWVVNVGIEEEYPEAGIEKGYAVFTNDEVLRCFEPVLNRCIELIKEKIARLRSSNRELRYLILSGGFAESEFLFAEICRCLEGVPVYVVRPISPRTAVVRGGLISGCNKIRS